MSLAAFDFLGIGGGLSGAGITKSDVGAAGNALDDVMGFFASKDKVKGAKQEAKQYRIAGADARQNAVYAGVGRDLKMMQAEREGTAVIGQSQADIAGNGLKNSGSASYILADAASQMSLDRATQQYQGNIQVKSLQDQAKSYDAMAKAADAQAKAEKKGGIMKLVGAGLQVASMFL